MIEPLRLESLTVEYRRGVVACRDVTLSVAEGSIYALLGHAGAGKTSIVDVILGRHKPTAGRALIFGEDSRKNRRSLSRRIGAEMSSSGLSPELLVRDDPPSDLALPRDARCTAFLATDDTGLVEATATHVGILKTGRLVLEGSVTELESRFRRIRYANRLTETRTEFGTELDAFDAVRVRVRGWGIDAIVSNFSDSAFEKFRSIDGVDEAQALPLTISEVFVAVAGEAPPQSGLPAQ